MTPRVAEASLDPFLGIQETEVCQNKWHCSEMMYLICNMPRYGALPQHKSELGLSVCVLGLFISDAFSPNVSQWLFKSSWMHLRRSTTSVKDLSCN